MALSHLQTTPPLPLPSRLENLKRYEPPPRLAEHYSSPAMEVPALAATADPYFPICVSSDEDDDVEVIGASNSPEGIQIQPVVLLPVHSSASPSGTAVAGPSEGSIPDPKGKRRIPSGVPKFPMASQLDSLFNPEIHQVIDVDDESLHHRVIDVDDYRSRRDIDVDDYRSRRIINVDDDSLIYVGEIDCKGKKLCSGGVLQELGQCSSGSGKRSSGFYCTICMEEVRATKRFPIPGCTHAFCISCVRQYIAAKVEENVLSIACPDPGCKDGGALHPEACRCVIPPQLFQRWGEALCDMALGALKFYCPFKDCSALLVHDPVADAAIADVQCPHCRRTFCAQCKVPWHDGVTCAEFQRLGKDEREREDLLLRKVAKENKWQRCPKCKIYVERVAGCVFIMCRCKNCFCYLCGSTMERTSHHCKKCNRTY